MTDLRCRRQQELTGHRGRNDDPFYRARRDLVRARENLTPRGELRLSDAFAADPYDELEAIHTIKELLRDIYQTAASSEEAAAAFDDWFAWVDTYDVAEGHRLAGTIRSWLAEVLAYFDTGLTNGRTEGKNLIIKQVKRQGFGYRNPHH